MSTSNDQSASINREAEERHTELFNAIREKKWYPEGDGNIAEFSDQIHLSITIDSKTRFYKGIFARLYFYLMFHLAERIPAAYQNSFEWIFGTKLPQQSNSNGTVVRTGLAFFLLALEILLFYLPFLPAR